MLRNSHYCRDDINIENHSSLNTVIKEIFLLQRMFKVCWLFVSMQGCNLFIAESSVCPITSGLIPTHAAVIRRLIFSVLIDIS